VQAASGVSFTLGDNGTGALDTVAGGGAIVTLQAGAFAQFWGDGYQVQLGLNATLAAGGDNEILRATAGDSLWLGDVFGDTITGAGFNVSAASGAAVSLGGNGASGAVDGAAGAGVEWTLLSGSNADFWSGGDTIVSQGQSDYAIYGEADMVTAASGDSITDDGGGLSVAIGSNVGAVSLSHLGSDATGVIDLLSGAGGYISASAAWGAVQDDGSGGSTLSLGSAGVIHFTDATKEGLSSANFKIG
jgi:hypothetical protein